MVSPRSCLSHRLNFSTSTGFRRSNSARFFETETSWGLTDFLSIFLLQLIRNRIPTSGGLFRIKLSLDSLRGTLSFPNPYCARTSEWSPANSKVEPLHLTGGLASTVLVRKASASCLGLGMAVKGMCCGRSYISHGLIARRCQRLKKDCRPSPTVRKRSGRSSASRNAQLEAKLDNIVSLLQTTGATNIPVDWESVTAKPQSNGPPGPTGAPVGAPVGAPIGAPIGAYASPGISSPSSAACSTSSTDYSVHDICSSLPISPEEAEKTLNLMRVQNLKFLPFAYIPPHVTADQLRQDKPFFWLCIMAVTAPVNMQRDVLFGKITMLIHQKLLVEVSPSMDLLLGIMTFISWLVSRSDLGSPMNS